ncbi:MAG: response regulator [Lachnospiraceae bacterium]|nr:response regulator [Lachnospiraceae bacterium]
MLQYYAIAALLTLLSLIVVLVNFENRKSNYYFMLLLILQALSNGGYWAIALSTTVEEAILANKICYLGGCFIPIALLFFACDICHFKMPGWAGKLMYGYSFFVYALVLTSGYNKLYYEETYLLRYGNATVLRHAYGKFHACFHVILCGYFLVEVSILLYCLVKKPAVSRKNLYALLSIGLTSVLFFIIGQFVNPVIEVMPFLYVIDSWIFLYMHRRGMMYSIEDNIADSVEIQESVGYIMFDKKRNYLGCNGRAIQIFPMLSQCVVDKPMKENTDLAVISGWLDCFASDRQSIYSLHLQDKHYECNVVEMWYRKKVSGYMVELREDTDKWKYINLISKHNSELESFQIQLENKVAEQTEEVRLQQKKLQKLYVQTVTALSEAVDAKDRYTSGHSKRVAEYARLIAARMGKSKEEQDEIYRAGLLHDVGKIRIPADIINKSAKLTEEEYNIIKIHPVTGYHILRGISNNNYIAVGAKYHHERYDGKGYPNGLAGEKIPEVARILGVADSYDAMASNRSYRDALPQEVVRSEIEKGRGTQFDPEIADIMLQMIDEDKEYRLKQEDTSQKYILTVDDEIINYKIIKHIMSDEPRYKVIGVGSGRDAIEILEKQTFDLILLDVKMPDMDGLETLRLIRQKYQTPVVLMTGDKTLDISEEFGEYGCDDYITKPFLPLLVKEVVHNMTERTQIEG